MSTGSLFGASIAWDETGQAGQSSDGRVIRIEHSVLTGRAVATIPLHGRDVVTRRSRKTVELARAACEAALQGGV